VNRSGARRAGFGCSSIGAVMLAVLAGGAIIGWPIYLETAGTPASAAITEKRESVSIEYDEWFRRFQVMAAYSIPGQPVQHRAICDVDEKTYDSLHPGNVVVVHYFRNLLNQPFLPATHLSPCSNFASISVNSRVFVPLALIFMALLAIFFLYRALRIRMAAWLLLAWLCFTVGYLVLPRAEPDPRRPVTGTATVDSITQIDTVGETDNSDGIPLQQPYQIVRLKFVPEGMDTAVTAIDKIDEDSVPGLKEGQSAAIVYDATNPRIARLQVGTRSFPRQARVIVILCCIAFAVLAVLGWVVSRFFRKVRRSLPSRR
jgi:hypothetical protein